MQAESIWFGPAQAGTDVWPPLLEEEAMTAIAIAFDAENDEFVIAADGRCAVTAHNSFQVVSDTVQKFFPFESGQINVAFALTGLSAIGEFKFIPEIKNQLESLSPRSLRSVMDGFGYADKVFGNIVKVLEKAKSDGRIPGVPPCNTIPIEMGTKKFTLFIFGYFRGRKFFSQGEFHYDDVPGRFRSISFHKEFVYTQVSYSGPVIIGRMIYYPDAPIDPRIAHFKVDPSVHPTVFTRVMNFMNASLHPCAAEIDPICNIVGGHVHAAKVTKNGFEWLISPIL
jgi:hypothetical protein